MVQAALEGAQVGKHTVKKEPVTPEILMSLVERFAGMQATLSEVRGVCLCLLCFAGFLRHNELAKLRPCDFTFQQNHMYSIQ